MNRDRCERDSVDVLMVTYNRPVYTERTLDHLLSTCDKAMRIWIWQNGTDRQTVEVVRQRSCHPQVHRVLFSERNVGLQVPMNWLWLNATGQYLSKIDDDCLLPAGWARSLIDAHRANPSLGVVGCCRFRQEDLLPESANKKIRDLNGNHRILQNCWVQGSGFLMKRACIEDLGLLSLDESFPNFCIRLAKKGWLNGWYVPFIHEEHMDDPRSPFFEFKTDAEFLERRPLSALADDVRSIAEWQRRIRWVAQSVQSAPVNPDLYLGWRKKFRVVNSRLKRVLGMPEEWRLSPDRRVRRN